MLSMGMTGGVFQLSAGASMRLCQDMKPRNFEEIVAIMALVRPGPADSGMTADYLQRRRTGRWPRLNSIYEEVTAKTFGVLVYQEQVMKVISRVAGLPENTADKIRKIIGKKRDPEEFRPYWEMFRDGCLKMGTLTETEAEHFWEGLQKWAGYGFNRAHSVEYATLAYWSGFLKIHYPVEFFCALLSYGEFDDKREDKSRQRIMDEMAEAGLEIIPPKVGKSDACRWTTDGQSVFTPFVEIKGVGEEMARKCAGAAPEKTCPGGFFNISSFGGSATRGTKLEKVLKDIGAYDLEKRDWPPEYFSFCFDGRVSERAEAGRNHRPRALADSNQPARSRRSGHEGDGPPDGCAQKADHLPVNPITRGRFRLELPRECWGCELGANGHFPVPPSMGIYRAMIVGEAPGFEEDRDRRGFVGRAGDVLWDELARYNLTRRMFHVTNACKCFPAALKTPKPEHIKECYQFLSQEMAGVAPGLILVLGNVAYSAVWGGDREPKGITRLSGTTELDSRTWKTDLVYCVHPSAVLRNPGQNRPAFEAGIKLFAEMFLKMKED
jgi:DNA polymerase-3 subunit alpha